MNCHCCKTKINNQPDTVWAHCSNCISITQEGYMFPTTYVKHSAEYDIVYRQALKLHQEALQLDAQARDMLEVEGK